MKPYSKYMYICIHVDVHIYVPCPNLPASQQIARAVYVHAPGHAYIRVYVYMRIQIPQSQSIDSPAGCLLDPAAQHNTAPPLRHSQAHGANFLALALVGPRPHQLCRTKPAHARLRPSSCRFPLRTLGALAPRASRRRHPGFRNPVTSTVHAPGLLCS